MTEIVSRILSKLNIGIDGHSWQETYQNERASFPIEINSLNVSHVANQIKVPYAHVAIKNDKNNYKSYLEENLDLVEARSFELFCLILILPFALIFRYDMNVLLHLIYWVMSTVCLLKYVKERLKCKDMFQCNLNFIEELRSKTNIEHIAIVAHLYEKHGNNERLIKEYQIVYCAILRSIHLYGSVKNNKINLVIEHLDKNDCMLDDFSYHHLLNVAGLNRSLNHNHVVNKSAKKVQSKLTNEPVLKHKMDLRLVY